MNTDTMRQITEPKLLHRPSRPASARVMAWQAPHSVYPGRIKRTLDLVIASFLVLLILSWITPVLFVLIRLGSRGPLFFVQDRVGLNGKPFACIKFRTMRLSDRSETLQASADDERITRIGWFLRLTHIDELPQLINVLLDDMSLVGPRPHMLYHDMLFSALLPQYQFRHLVKPGITGLAQSAGYHGATSDFFSISNRTRLDLFYVKHISPGLDLKILLTTLFIVPVKCIKRLYAGSNGH